MTYSLHVDRTWRAVWDALPPTASEQFTNAMARVCDDPKVATDAYGIDDGFMRELVLPSVMAVLLVNEFTRRVTILNITYLD